MHGNIFSPGPTQNTVRAADGTILTAPEGWVLLPPGDAALTRRVKEAGDHIIFDQTNGNLYYDTDGGTSANRTLFATLTGVTGTSFNQNDITVLA